MASDRAAPPSRLGRTLELLAEIEDRFPINEWKADGVRLWPLVRMVLAYRASLPPALGLPESLIGRMLRRVRRAAPLAEVPCVRWRDPSHRAPRIRPAEVFFLTYSLARQAKLNGAHQDVLAGPLARHLDDRGIPWHAWEYSYFAPYRFPRSERTYLAQSELLGIQLRSRLGLSGAPRIELPAYEEFLSRLRDAGAMHAELERPAVVRQARYVLALRRRFRDALDRIGAVAAFAANMGHYELALHLACRDLGIASVELQHGLQGDHHGHYAGWTRVPAGGYELLPAGYWSWDPDSAQAINRWSAPVAPYHQAFVGGMPWMEFVRSRGNAAADPKHGAILSEPRDRKVLLVTLQPPEVIYGTARILPEFVLRAIAESDPSWTWWIRLHPMMRRGNLDVDPRWKRALDRAVIDAPTELPLYQLLNRADLHLTHSSASVVDAGRFGVRSVVWSAYGADLHSLAIRAGWCRTATGAEDLLRSIRESLAAGRFEPPSQGSGIAGALAHFLDLGRTLRAARP